MTESQDVIGRSFTHGHNVSVVRRDATHVEVTIVDGYGKPFSIDGLPYDQWVATSDFVRDATRQLLGTEWDGITVKGVAVEILDHFKEFAQQVENVKEYPGMPAFDDYRKRIEDADLADFKKTLQPITDTIERRQALVQSALQGVFDSFDKPGESSAEILAQLETVDELMKVAYVHGHELGEQLRIQYPDSDRLLNGFIQVFTAMGTYSWHAFGGVELDDADIAEFSHLFHGLFYKFSTKPRAPKPPADQVVSVLRQLIEKKQRAKNAGQQQWGPDMPPVSETGPGK